MGWIYDYTNNSINHQLNLNNQSEQYYFISIKYFMIRNSQFISRCFFANFNPSKDYYKTLNISATATQPEIKKAYLKYAKMYHPDTNKGK